MAKRKYYRFTVEQCEEFRKLLTEAKANSVLYAMLYFKKLPLAPMSREAQNALVYNITKYDDAEHWQDSTMNEFNLQSLHAQVVRALFPQPNNESNE